MKLFRIVPNSTEEPMKLYDIKKRKEAKELLAKYPSLFFKSFGKARKALSAPIKEQMKNLKEALKVARKVKKKAVKLVNLSSVEKMSGYDKLAEVAAAQPKVEAAPAKKEKKEKASKKEKKADKKSDKKEKTSSKK